MQFQADILDTPVYRPKVLETTALGAAYLAGLKVGYWVDRAELEANWAVDRRFTPKMDANHRDALTAGWAQAVSRTLTN